jgi:hypothetical protein
MIHVPYRRCVSGGGVLHFDHVGDGAENVRAALAGGDAMLMAEESCIFKRTLIM